MEKDLTGLTFNRLTVLRKANPLISGKYKWECRCICGNTTVVGSYKLVSGWTKSCGCLQREAAVKVGTTHGMNGTRLSRIYHAMKSRCYCTSNTSFMDYGGRGIKICPEWLGDPSLFFNWAINNGYADGLSIDRIDNEGDYTPENCRWATAAQQSRNTRATTCISIFGEKICLKDAQTLYGLNEETLRKHLNCESKLNGYLQSHFRKLNTATKQNSKRVNGI